MIALAILVAVLLSGALGAVLRRRAGNHVATGTVRKGDRPEVGVHAGFTNHICGG